MGAVRRGFIRRVYSILMVQLVFTGAIISLFSFVEDLKGYVRYNRWVMWASWGLALVITLILACCGEIRRKTPHNFIFLGLFTACWSVMLGTTTAFYDVDAILIAVGCTAAVTLVSPCLLSKRKLTLQHVEDSSWLFSSSSWSV